MGQPSAQGPEPMGHEKPAATPAAPMLVSTTAVTGHPDPAADSGTDLPTVLRSQVLSGLNSGNCLLALPHCPLNTLAYGPDSRDDTHMHGPHSTLTPALPSLPPASLHSVPHEQEGSTCHLASSP